MTTNFTEYKTKQDFLNDFPIKDGRLDLSGKRINDDDLKHILDLIDEEPNLRVLFLSGNKLTTISKNAFNGLPNCSIFTDPDVEWVGYNEMPVITNSNVIDSLNAKAKDIGEKAIETKIDSRQIVIDEIKKDIKTRKEAIVCLEKALEILTTKNN